MLLRLTPRGFMYIYLADETEPSPPLGVSNSPMVHKAQSHFIGLCLMTALPVQHSSWRIDTMNKRMSMFAPVALLLLIALAGCSGTREMTREMTRAPLLSGIVRGEAFYRERIALPPGTQLEVFLEDVSRSDAPPIVVGKSIRTLTGAPPYRFEIRYQVGRIDRSHLYAIRAQLIRRGVLLFITNRSYPVITRGDVEEPKLLLVLVRRQ